MQAFTLNFYWFMQMLLNFLESKLSYLENLGVLIQRDGAMLIQHEDQWKF